MGNKVAKKIFTEDSKIDVAEQKLGIKYPLILREKLKAHNGFSWGYFERFYCVFDEDDKFHTFDDVVYENENPRTGWKSVLPPEYVAIADDAGGYCLALNTNKDGKVYHYNSDTNEIEVFAENDEDLKTKLDQQDKELQTL